MSEITGTVVALNRYAVGDAQAVLLYNYNGAEDLTMGQLIAAFSIHRAAVCEARSVAVMNRTNAMDDQIEFLAQAIEDILAQRDWAKLRAELLKKTKISADALPTSIEKYNNMMKAVSAVKDELVRDNSSLDKAMIELESVISARDVVMDLSTTMIKHYGDGCMSLAANY